MTNREPQDTGRVAIRIIVAVVTTLVSLAEAALTPQTFVILIDLALILIAIGFGLGKQRAGDICIVATLLVAVLSGYQWLVNGDVSQSFIAVVWILLFAGTYYAKPTTVRKPSGTPPDRRPD